MNYKVKGSSDVFTYEYYKKDGSTNWMITLYCYSQLMGQKLISQIDEPPLPKSLKNLEKRLQKALDQFEAERYYI
jgi:hypothetical protein